MKGRLLKVLLTNRWNQMIVGSDDSGVKQFGIKIKVTVNIFLFKLFMYFENFIDF